MCEYCEPLTSDKFDSYGHKYRKLLPVRFQSNDIDDHNTMASLNPPTPISKRRHAEDGLAAELEVYFSDDRAMVSHVYIPIKYCPMCGKEIE